MKPRIGIPLCLDAGDRIRPGRRYHYGDTAFALAVTEAGGIALQLPIQEPRDACDAIDGLLLPGGDDLLPPEPYPATIQFDPVPDEQLRFDLALLAHALERNLPVLGICYGMQLLALAHGGSLHYDIPHDCPAATAHHLEDDARHTLHLEPGTHLAALLPGTAHGVNSRHHQAVASPGTLHVCARTEDGLVEAIESPDHPFALGVQWHPEGMDAAHRRSIFGAFVSACSGA